MSIIRKVFTAYDEMVRKPEWANKDYNLMEVIATSLPEDEQKQYRLEGKYYFDLFEQGLSEEEIFIELDKIVLREQGYVLE